MTTDATAVALGDHLRPSWTRSPKLGTLITMITKQGDKEPNDKMYHTRARVHTKHTANRRTDKRTHEKQKAEFDDHQLFAGIFITNLCF